MSKRSGGRAWALPFLLFTLLFGTKAFAVGETTGRITGYVYDPTGAPLAEVPLTLTGTNMQGSRNRTSGDDGRFEFEALQPGDDYVIEVDVPGFTKIRQKAIKVYLGQNTPVDVHLTVLTETQAVQTYEIVEKVNPIINPDSAQTGAVVSAEKAATTPIFHQVEGMPSQVAGVASFSNKPSTRGGLSRWGKFYVDGMDTTDIQDGSITAPMNFDAVENFEIITGGFDAQYNSLGMVENVVTKTGSNRFQLDSSVVLEPNWLAIPSNAPTSQPTTVGQYVNPATPAPPGTSFYDANVNVGGAIVKDKLWYYVSAEARYNVVTNNLVLPDGSTDLRPKPTLSLFGRAKLTWQMTERDRLSIAVNLNSNRIDNYSFYPNEVTRQAEEFIQRQSIFFIVNYDHNFSDNVLFQLQAGTTYQEPLERAENLDDDAVSHQDYGTYFTRFSAANLVGVANYIHEQKNRIQFDPMLTFKLKNHQLKAGIQMSYLRDTLTTGVTGNERYIDQNLGLCDPNDSSTFSYCKYHQTFYDANGNPGRLTTTGAGFIFGAFLQDRWVVNRQLTIVPGIRFDLGRLYGQDNQLATTNLVGWGPRLSATYDLFSNRKSLIVAHYGRSNDVGDMAIAQHANPSLTEVQATWNSTTNSFPDCNPSNMLPGCTQFGGPAGRYLASGNTPPHVDEVAAGFHQATDSEAVFGVDLTWRKYSDLWSDKEVNRIFDPSGNRIIGYVDNIPHSVVRGGTYDAAWREYAGMDLWVQGTPGNWDLLASYTLSYNWGTVTDYFDSFQANPRYNIFAQGYLPDDHRHVIKASVTYKSPIGLDIGMRFRYQTGAPEWESFTSSGNSGTTTYKSPRGTGFSNDPVLNAPDFNNPYQWTELRDPSEMVIDLQARYNLGKAFNMQQKLELVGLWTNVLGDTSFYSASSKYTTSFNHFGQGLGRISPSQFELLIRFRN